MTSELPEQLRELADSLDCCQWNHPITGVRTCVEAAQEIERLRAERIDLVRWMLDRIEDGWHGCVTGDCPHEQASDCIDSLLECFDVDMAAKAAGGGEES